MLPMELNLKMLYVVEYPVNSNYNGPSIAPCVINASNNGNVGNLQINAPDGILKNVFIDLGSTGNYISTVTINYNIASGSSGSCSSPFTSSLRVMVGTQIILHISQVKIHL